MFLTNSAIKRPVAMCSLIIALVLLGLNSYRKLPLEFLPKIETAYITVVTVYPGASPTEIETDIAKRIEDAVIAIDGLKHVTSSCMENVCQTLLEFHQEVDTDEAANDVREKIDLIINDFPETVERPKVLKYDVNAKPIMNIALTGDLTLDELFDYADNTLRDRISVLKGVADLQLIGGAEREVHVLLDRDMLAARGLTIIEVIKAIKQGILTVPSGRVQQLEAEYSVKFDAEYKSVQEIGDLEVANENGSRCYIKDIGKVTMTTEELRRASFIDGRPCIGMKVVKKADANTVQVVNLVRDTVEEAKKTLPGGMELVWVSDDGAFVQASASSTSWNIVQGVILTGIVLFFFLFNFRSTMIVSITMPLTMVISLFFMLLLGFTLNTSTLIAIGLSVGILVTNSIVVLESIVSRSTTESNPYQAARNGAGDVALAVLASAGTNIVVLFPVSMMGTVVGEFFNPFALTMVTVTAISLFISFTLTPILCSVLMQRNSKKNALLERMETGWNQAFNRLSAGYEIFLHVLTRRRFITGGLIVAVFTSLIFTLKLVPELGFSFVPDVDKGEVFVKLEYPTRYNLKQTISRVHEAEELFRGMPNLLHIFTTIGKVEGRRGQTSEGVYLAQILLKFTEKTDRTEALKSILTKIRSYLVDYSDSIVSVNISTPTGSQSNPIDLEIAGEDRATLDIIAERVIKLSREIKGIVDLDSSVRSGKPELRILPRRAVLADLNMPASVIGMALRGNIEGIEAGSYKKGARSYDIRVKFEKQEGKDQVKDFLFPGEPGHPITLMNVAYIEENLAPVQITRQDKRRVSKVFSNLSADLPLGTAVNKISGVIDEKGKLPVGYSYRFAGEYEILEEAKIAFFEAGILAVVLTYLVLAAILESFFQPFIILFTIPLALIGFIWALYFTGKSIDVFVLLGGVMLIGIVVNNAILIMDQMKQHLAEGMPRREAMVQAAVNELRPIIMITMAAVLGMIPLATGSGLGSELRAGIGIASVGGIFISGLLTLSILPALYNLFVRDRKSKQREKKPL